MISGRMIKFAGKFYECVNWTRRGSTPGSPLLHRWFVHSAGRRACAPYGLTDFKINLLKLISFGCQPSREIIDKTALQAYNVNHNKLYTKCGNVPQSRKVGW